jgi:RNA-directed DNA polymerase
VVSPVLSNIYLHYVLDLWFERRFKKYCRGYAELTRFADDFIAAFKYHEEAMQFRREMEQRLLAFGLRVAPEKTALLCFDANLLKQTGRQQRRLSTFAFLGFTHYLARARSGTLNIMLKPTVKARERFIRSMHDWLKTNKHLDVREQHAHLVKALQGYYQYFGLRLCSRYLNGVRQRVRKLWRETLRRRSQRATRRTDWGTLLAKPWFQLPVGRVTQAWI